MARGRIEDDLLGDTKWRSTRETGKGADGVGSSPESSQVSREKGRALGNENWEGEWKE